MLQFFIAYYVCFNRVSILYGIPSAESDMLLTMLVIN